MSTRSALVMIALAIITRIIAVYTAMIVAEALKAAEQFRRVWRSDDHPGD